YYGRVTSGQHINDSYAYTLLDEAGKSDGGPDQFSTFPDDLWRVCDYGLIPHIIKFLEGLRAADIQDDGTDYGYEGEVRFLRAWVYFNTVKTLGGMPIVGDEVFEYAGGTDITSLQYPRATEAELYDYIISECDAISDFLPEEPSVNAARATKWSA